MTTEGFIIKCIGSCFYPIQFRKPICRLKVFIFLFLHSDISTSRSVEASLNEKENNKLNSPVSFSLNESETDEMESIMKNS